MSRLLGESDESALQSAIDRLKAEGAKFMAAYETLMNDYDIAATDASLLAEWLSLKEKADAIRNAISWVNSQVDAAASWFSSLFGLSGLHALNILPLIPIAYVTAAIASLLYVVSSIYEFHAKVELVRQKLAPGDILTAPSIVGETGSLLKWGIIGAAAYFVLPSLLKTLKGKAR